MKPAADIWSDWLLRRRHGGAAGFEPQVLAAVHCYRDRVLDGARLLPGMKLLDVGCGNGLIGFGAIERIGPQLHVVMSDLSPALLKRAEEIAVERGVRDQCTFLPGSAERLDGLEDRSIDVVTTRSVLAYVADKPAAFREFRRVLKPGGRISIAEPIFQDDALETCAITQTIASQPASPQIEFLKLVQRWRAAQYPSTLEEMSRNPMFNYSERNLIGMIRAAGFERIHLEMHINQFQSDNRNWDCFIDCSPHPLAPTLREIMSERFSHDERAFFERILRPTIESGQHISIENMVYVTAQSL